MKSGTTNPEMKKIMITLKKMKKPIWSRIAKEMEKPKRKRIAVNLWKINKHTKEGETVIIPGKVLSEGELDHKVTIAAYQFSQSVHKKANGKYITIQELLKTNPDGKNVKIIK